MQIINNPCSCFVELRELLSRVPRDDAVELRTSLKMFWIYQDFGPSKSQLVDQLLKKLSVKATNKVLLMFSNGHEKIRVGGVDLFLRLERDLGYNGKGKLLSLFRLIKGNLPTLVELVDQKPQILGEYLCDSFIDSS